MAKSRREAENVAVMNSWSPRPGLWVALGMGFRDPGTHLMAAMRTCCVEVIGVFRSDDRLSRSRCHAEWDALAAHVLDRCDCPHDETPEVKPKPAIERQLADERRAFLDSTRPRLPVPDGWDVREMAECERETSE